MEELLVKYIKHLREENFPVSKDLIIESALRISDELKIVDFKASNGWFERFKKRKNIGNYKESGEAEKVDKAVVKIWEQDILTKLLKKFDKSDIYNADETGLFYEILQSTTYNEKGASNKTKRNSKKRVTLLLCTNMTGDFKMTPYLIGTSKKPRCFKNIKNLPVKYFSNKSAWMTANIFHEFLTDLNLIQRKKGKKGCIIIDNAPVHNIENIAKFDMLEIVFLPPNTTSVLQPLDNGIIRSFKSLYKKYLLRSLIEKFEMKEKVKINILECSLLTKNAWDSISTNTISNCFENAFKNVNINSTELKEKYDTKEEEIIFKEKINDNFLLSKVDQILSVNDNELFEKPTIEYLVEEYKANEEIIEEDSEISDKIEKISSKKAIESIRLLKNFFLQNPKVEKNIFKNISDIEQTIFDIKKINSKQKTLFDINFFIKK